MALVLSIAALDSLNPSTVGPALVIAAAAPRPAPRVAAFAAGVFVVYTAGGIVLLVGPGQALLAYVAKPSARAEHIAALACGAALVCVAAALWVRRNRPRKGHARVALVSRRRSALALGGGIMAVELPTAVPYFAALVAITASRRDLAVRLLLVAMFNVVFVLPLVVIVLLALLAGARAEERMLALRLSVERHAPTGVPVIVGAAGVVLLAYGARLL